MMRLPLAVHQLLFRLGVASVFLRAGMVKVSSWESTIALFRDEYRVPLLSPALAAGLATSFELACSTLLVLGLATRLATLPLLGIVATIQLFVYPGAWSEHLVWGSILLFILTRGPGAISLDHLIARAWTNRRRGARPPGNGSASAISARRPRPRA
jgi:putative oxidoreductase